MSKLMSTRWPILLIAGFWLTMGIESVINAFIRKESNDLSLFFIIAGGISLFVIGAFAAFALSDTPYLPDGKLNPINRSSTSPISRHPTGRPLSFIVDLFMLPIFTVPTLEVDLYFGFNSPWKYLGLLVGPAVFGFALLLDCVFRRLSGKQIARSGSYATTKRD